MKASNDGHMGRAVSSFAEPADSECEAPCVPLASSGDAHPTAAELGRPLSASLEQSHDEKKGARIGEARHPVPPDKNCEICRGRVDIKDSNGHNITCPKCILSARDFEKYLADQTQEYLRLNSAGGASSSDVPHTIEVEKLNGERYRVQATSLQKFKELCLDLASSEAAGCHVIDKDGEILNDATWQACERGALVFETVPERRTYRGMELTFEELQEQVPPGRVTQTWSKCTGAPPSHGK